MPAVLPAERILDQGRALMESAQAERTVAADAPDLVVARLEREMQFSKGLWP